MAILKGKPKLDDGLLVRLVERNGISFQNSFESTKDHGARPSDYLRSQRHCGESVVNFSGPPVLRWMDAFDFLEYSRKIILILVAKPPAYLPHCHFGCFE